MSVMKNIVILISGSGTNLQRILEAIKNGEISNAKVSLVIADRECYGLKRAEENNIDNILIPRGKGFSAELEKILPGDTDLIVLAGFLSILSKDFTEEWNGKIINIHPSLLPKFGGKGMYGSKVHQSVVETNEKESGATVHFVTSGIDEGEIILQGKVLLDEHETPETLAEKVHQIEYEIFPKAIEEVLNIPL